MLAEMFMLLDEDHDGVIDIDELRDDMETVLKGETRTPEELMAETDTNGDGHIWSTLCNLSFIVSVHQVHDSNRFIVQLLLASNRL
jgi:Ca2+-binding EF-hand superfamily protein